MLFPLTASDLARPAMVALLAARGGGLEALVLVGEIIPKPVAEAAARHYASLRRLRVDVSACAPGGLVTLVRGVAGGLRDFALVGTNARTSVPALEVLRELCLTRFELRFRHGDEGVQELFREIIDRNGASLSTLALSAKMAIVPLLEDVAAAWPNVLFDVEAFGDAAPKVLSALDSRLVSLKLSSHDESVAARDIDCCFLETLFVDRPTKRARSLTVKVLRALFAKRGFPSLRHVVIRDCGMRPNLSLPTPGSLLAVLQTAGGLLSLDLESSWQPADAFQAVAWANPSLVDVSLRSFG